MENNSPQASKQRYFSLTNLAVDNSTSIFIVTFMILIFGIQSYNRMPKEQFPEVVFPQIYINTPYFGNSAADIENLVTRPIEKEIQSIQGIKNVNSTSMQDYSVIIAEFETDEDIDNALRKVKDAVDKSKSELPTDLTQEPYVTDINLSEIPIMTVNVSGNYNNDELRNYADYIKDHLEDIDEVSKVDMKGALEREVQVNADISRMQAVKVSFGDIANAVSAENLNMSGGELVNNDFRRAIRVVGQFENVSEIENLIVKSEFQNPIYLKDIATVKMAYQDRTSYARSDGLPVISLDVIKRKGQNLLDASDHVKEVIDKVTPDLPSDLRISIFNDQSIHTRDQVSNLENSIISGVILVVLVLLFFLGLRNALFVGMAIPWSMLMGIMWLYLSGTTMNIIVLFSLILALGMLVDNAIVVVENIYRYMQNGYKGIEAAKRGAGEVAMPIISSTATTLAAFIPLAFWPGIVGNFMQYLPLTLIIVLTSSLLVALVINPVFTATFMKVDKRLEQKSARQRKRRNVLLGVLFMVMVAIGMHLAGIEWARNLLGIAILVTLVNFFFLRRAAFYFQNNLLPILENSYDRFVRFALRRKNPLWFFAGTFGLLFFALALLAIKSPAVIFFSKSDPLYVNAFIELPIGTDIEATNKLMHSMEDRIKNAIEPYQQVVESVLVQIGENTSDPNSPPEPGASPHKSRITVAFVPSDKRNGVSTVEIMEKIRESLQGYPGVQIVVDQNANGPPTGKPINLELRGEDINKLATLSEDVINYFNSQNIPGIEELKADVGIGKPELIVNIDRDAARRYDVSTYSIADAIRTSVFGKEISKYKEGEDEYPIQLRVDTTSRNSITDLMNQVITFRDMATGKIAQVPISAVATNSYNSSYSSIKRKNGDRVITVYSNVLDGYNANSIVTELKKLMTNYDLPEGFTYEFTGEQQQQTEDLDFLSTAFAVAIFLIFIIIVAQFNSIVSPFIIMLTVLFSTIGVFLGYAFSGRDFVIVFTGIGIISLAGVVVNNAIVLIDYTQLLLKQKREALGVDSDLALPLNDVKEAIVMAGSTRLRPVLLTAITTVLGLIPLAIGFNFDFFSLVQELDPHVFIGGDNATFWGPMAWTVIYGLVFATFLTLVVVPVMFWLAHRAKLAGSRLFKSNEPSVG
ncbi:MAG: efflux RND transporter permease subunit [Saprospiraceae bacterium]|nr:efflux RND transporter permease subunit [Saprospiraceae bacterium]MCB9320889.1 efflux RND transporter permease subunit [Lewinellaceae bacterium]